MYVGYDKLRGRKYTVVTLLPRACDSQVDDARSSVDKYGHICGFCCGVASKAEERRELPVRSSPAAV